MCPLYLATLVTDPFVKFYHIEITITLRKRKIMIIITDFSFI